MTTIDTEEQKQARKERKRNDMWKVYYRAMAFCAGDIEYLKFAEETSKMKPIDNFRPLDEMPECIILAHAPDADEMIRNWVYNACRAFASGAYSHDEFLHEVYNAYKAYREIDAHIAAGGALDEHEIMDSAYAAKRQGTI